MKKFVIHFITTFLMVVFTNVVFAETQTTDIKISQEAKKPVLNIEHWQIENGPHVYFVKRTQLPMVDITVAFRAGSSRDGATPGLANLTASMLDEGTTTLSSNDIALGFDNLGSIFSSSADRDMSVITVRTLSEEKTLNSTLKLLADVLAKANFPEDAFKRVQQNMLQAIKLDQEDPGTVATQAFFRTLYKDGPYGHPVMGSIESVSPLTRDDLQKFYQQYYVANNAFIAIVGDVSSEQAHDIAKNVVANLPVGTEAQPVRIEPNVSNQNVKILYPSTQTYIRLGQMGIRYGDPNYFPLMVGNYVLGGSTVSHLFKLVREQHGLSYGIASYFAPMAEPGPFLIELQTRNHSRDQAIQLTKSVLAKYLMYGPSDAELKAAQKFITGSFPLRIESNSNISTYLTLIGFYKLPLNYLDNYQTKVNAVTREQIQAAMQQHIQLNHLITISVGGKNNNG